MAEILLLNGGIALVDDIDLERVSRWNWSLGNRGYAMRREYVRGSSATKTRYRNILLHRFILGTAAGVQVDHRDGNKLDNRRANLRECSHKENARNIHVVKSGRRFKGVDRVKRSARWRARIMADSREHHLGMFDTEELAAAAYDQAAISRFGAFAALNLPKGAGNLSEFDGATI